MNPLVVTSLVAVVALLLSLPYPYDPLTIAIATPVVLAVVAAGTAASRTVGIPTGGHESAAPAVRALITGLALGVTLLVVMRFGVARLEPKIIDRLVRDAQVPLWRWAIILFHAPILEEVIFRLFLLSSIAWAISRARPMRTAKGQATAGALTVANAFAASAFAVIHLPAWYQAGPVSPALLIAVLRLNLGPGYVLGAVFVRHGLPAAVLTHLGADIGLHLGGRLIV